MAVAVEGCTRWRYVVEEIAAAGFEAQAAICMARKLARRCHHTLRQIDPEVVHAMPA